MSFQSKLAAAAAALILCALPVAAQEHPEGMHIHDVYARSNGQEGGSGAVFLMMHNNSETDNRLIGVASPVAEKVELHTHIESADGVMQMIQIEGGIALAAGEMHEFARGGDHVMLMGLTQALADGDTFPLTFIFEQAGEITVEAVVDNARKPGEGMMDHSGHGDMDHSGHGDGHDHTGHGMQEGDASDAMQHGHDAHMNGGHEMAAIVDQTGMADPEAIVAVMKAQFDTPENPLTVTPVVVEGDHALASWEQGGKGGRALLRKGDMGWEIVLCGGEDLRMPAFLDQHGVTASKTLSALFNAEEDKLGANKVALYSTFDGVVMVAGQ
jgi:copper(I)-binding protein